MASLARVTRKTRGPAGTASAVAGGVVRVAWLAFALILGLVSGLSVAGPAAAQSRPATLMADQVYVDGAGRLVASGAVEVWHGSTRMTAERVVFDRRQDQLIVEGAISVSDGPDQVILADAAQLSPSLRTGILTSARVMLDQQLQIAAARVRRGANGVSQMDAVVASSCPVCASNPTPLWEIRADRVTHDENTRRLLFERAQFRLAGVPVFYAPRLALPAPGNPRLRGFLRPVFGMDSALGFSVGMPYFIPFGDTRDLTLTPTLRSSGSATLGFRWRVARQNGGIEIGGQISRDTIRPGELRGYGYFRALFQLRDDWRLTADVMIPSDRTYLETYDITDDPRLRGHVTLERIHRDQAARARVLGFYSLRAADVNDELPNRVVEADLDRRIGLESTPLGGELRLRLGARAFWRNSAIDGVRGRDVARAHAELGWRRSGVLAGGVLVTGALDARVDHVRVSDDSAYPNPVTRRAVQGMIEFRWPWARTSDGGVAQLIEPVVQVIGSRLSGGALPNDDHTMPELDGGNLFALSRYSGEDAPDDNSRLNAGLRWTRHDPQGWTGEALVGRIWRRTPLAGFNPAHVQPLGFSASNWLLAGRVSNADGYAMSLRLLMDANARLTRTETNLAWEGTRTSLSTTYLYLPASAFESRTTDLSEWSIDLARRFGNGWATTVGWNYDVGQSLFATARAGMTYRTECLSMDMSLVRNFVTSTNPTASTSFDLRIELLGIGGRAPGDSGRTCRA